MTTDRLMAAFVMALCLLSTLVPAWGAAPGAASADSDAVILLYHHVANDTPASTSVTPDTFRAHLRHLHSHGYRVVPLSRIMAALGALGKEQPLPARAVAITFDDAYDSVHDVAAPMLEQFGYPYTVFVSTDYLDQGLGNYLTWDQLRDLERRGAEIGNYSRTHGHYVHRPPPESPAQWRRRIRNDIQAAQQRLEAELKQPLKALAYPYGEFRPALTALAGELGYVAFGQQSGPVGPASDAQALPRFPMASRYADVESLAEKLRTRAFRVSVLTPREPVLAADAGAPTLRLDFDTPDARLDALSCFVTGQASATVRWTDRQRGIVEVTARDDLPAGRSKYTCTAPAVSDKRVYYWYSHLWMKPPAPGAWYRD